MKMFVIILFNLYIKVCLCQASDLILESPQGTFQIEANLTLTDKQRRGQTHNWFVKETVTIDSDNNSIGIMETSDKYQVEQIKFFYRYHNGTNGMERKRLVVNKNRCSDPSVGGYSDAGSKSFDCILSLGIFYFYQNLLLRKSRVYNIIAWGKEIHLDDLFLGYECQSMSHEDIGTIFEIKYGQNGKTLGVEQLTTVTLNSYANDFDAEFNVTSVKKLLSTYSPLPIPLHVGCPYFLQKEDPKFPGQNLINRYHVKVSETIDIKSNNGLESIEKHEFSIDTLNEISKITKLQQKKLTVSINDYHFGIKYLLRDGADDLKCQVEPISLNKDSMTMTKGSLSFNDIAWMDNPFEYAGKYQLAWSPNNGNQTKNVTFDVWQNTIFMDQNYYQVDSFNYSFRAKIITTLYMMNQSTFNEKSNSTPGPSEALFGFIPIRVQRDVYNKFVNPRDANEPKVSHERRFSNFNTRLINSQYPSSIFGFNYMDQCFNGAMNKSVTIKLKITNSDKSDVNQVINNFEVNSAEIRRSLLRITINHLHVSFLRIKDITIRLADTDFVATVQVFEAVDLIGLHTKKSQRFDLETLKTFQSIDARKDHDCFSKQGSEINISYVISCPPTNNCPALDKFLCIGIKSGQSLPNENKDGISCSIFDNTYNTLSTVAEEASLKDIIKYSSRLRGLTFQVNHTFYRIADSWTIDHPNFTDIELPSQHYLEPTQSTNNEQAKKRSSIKATNVTNGTSANAQSTQKSKHFSGSIVLIILLLIIIILSLVGFQVHEKYFLFKSPTSDSNIISLTTLN